MSAVTNLKAFDSAPKKQIRDTTEFLFEGNTYTKGRIMLAVITKYANDHSGITLSEALEVIERTGYKRHYVEVPITLADGSQVAVSRWIGGMEDVKEFVVLARKLGYVIK